MNTLSISNWIVNAFGERCGVRDAICFVPICRLLHLKPSGNRICPRMNLSGAFKDLKGGLSIRPIRHQLEKRIEAHIFVSFLAYCLHTTLRNLARGRAAGLTSDAILKKLSIIQMIDIHLPTTDGRHIVMSRYTQPDKDVSLLLAQLGLSLPDQPPPKVYASGQIGL